jgi:hypothetical protein
MSHTQTTNYIESKKEEIAVSDHVKVNKSEQMPTLPFSKFGSSCRLQSDCFFIRKINRMLAANERDKGKNGPLTLASERERRVP